MLYDCHVHSTFSPDGKSTVAEYVKLIDQELVKGIGFAEHLDFLPECGAVGYLDYTLYKNTIKHYKELGYEVYAGAEIDYAKSVENDILSKLNETPYDFTICSVHMIKGLPMSDRNIDHFFDKNNFLELIEGYYNEIKSSLKAIGFDVMGHVGVYRRYLDEDFYDADMKKWLKELDNEVASLCAKSHKLLEINSSGLFSVCKSTVPGITFLQAYFEYGGRNICMSSDAHNALHMSRGFDVVRDILIRTGLNYIYLPWDKENPLPLK